MPPASKIVWFLVVPGTGLLNIGNPWEVLGHANDVLGRVAYQLELVGPCGPQLPTRHGLTVGGIRALPKTTKRLPDIAIVAGGSPRTPLPDGEALLVPWLRHHHSRIPRLVSICTGAFVLGEAGILDGRRATTHWLHLSDLKSRFPAAHVVDQGIFVKDGNVWTSAGLTAGVDLSLALIEEDHGHRVAMTVAKRMVLFLRRSGKQAQFSSALQRQEKEPARLRDISVFVLEHLDQSLPVARIAAQIGMSARTLNRWCREHLDESPAEIVRRLRIDEAQRLLAETELPLKDITTRTGLGDASTLWRVFSEHLGVTPAAYRQRFSSATVR
jgi:transcriptional regulator GlxA family with amidase domain